MASDNKAPFNGYFAKKKSSFVPVDPDKVAYMQKRLAGWGMLNDFVKTPEAREAIENLAVISSFQPNSKTTLPTGVGFVQAAYIGDELLPSFIGGADEKADYPVFGNELFAGDDKVNLALSASPARVDITIFWETVKLAVKALSVATDRRELNASVTLPIGLDSYKLDVLRTRLANARELDQAAFMVNTANYTNTPTNPSNLWDTAAGTPIDDVIGKREKIRHGKARRRPDTFWMGSDVFQSLSFNTQIKEVIKYTGNKAPGMFGTGVTAEALAALFGMRVVIGEAGTNTMNSATVSDVWGQSAGLAIVEPGQLISPRFGLTLGGSAYPFTDTYEDKSVGPFGGTVSKYSDAWTLVLTTPCDDSGTQDTSSEAAYLWPSACSSKA